MSRCPMITLPISAVIWSQAVFRCSTVWRSLSGVASNMACPLVSVVCVYPRSSTPPPVRAHPATAPPPVRAPLIRPSTRACPSPPPPRLVRYPCPYSPASRFLPLASCLSLLASRFLPLASCLSRLTSRLSRLTSSASPFSQRERGCC